MKVSVFVAALLTVGLIANHSPVTAGRQPIITETRVWMSDPELRSAFSDKTIQGLYASGKAFSETYRADGSIAYQEQGAAYSGHWSVQAGSFCTIYQTDPTGGCFQVRAVSTNCYEFYFVTRTEEQAAEGELGRPAWTARAAVSDRDATCEDKPAV